MRKSSALSASHLIACTPVNAPKRVIRLFAVLSLLLCGSAAVNAQTTYYSKSTATVFSDPNSWGSNTDGSGTSPASISNADIFEVRNSAAMVLDANAEVQKLTVSSGSLTIASNTLTVGIANQNNSSFTISGGTLNMNGGTLAINGNFLQSSGSFNQTAGSILVDGNNNNDAATSVASGTHHFRITTTGVNCTGGTITIVDPPVNTYGTSTTRSINISTSQGTNYFSGTHSFILGDGVSTTPGNSDGFVIETYSSARCFVNHVVANGGSAFGRWVGASYSSGAFGTHIKGTLTINSGSEFRVNQTLTSTNELMVGSIVNNGTMTTGRTTGSPILFIGGHTGITTYVPATVSSISGSGVFRDVPVAPTAHFANLGFYNAQGISIAAGVLTLGSYTGNVSGAITFTAGEVTLNNQIMVLGTSTSVPGSLAFTAGGFNGGSFKRFIGTGTLPSTLGSTGNFPFLVTGDNRTFQMAATTAPTTGGSITVSLTSTTGNSTVSGTDPSGNYSFNRLSNAYWTVTPADGLAGGIYSASASTDGLLVLQSISTEPRLVQSATAGIGTHDLPTGSTSIPVGTRTGLTFGSSPVNFALAFNNSNLAFYTVQSGPWDDANTWNAGRAPSSSDNVTIMAGHTVTLSTTAGTANTVLLNANAILNISGSTLTVNSPSAAGAVFTANTSTSRVNINGGTLTIGNGSTRFAGYQNNGILNVTSGTLNVNGYLISASGSSFTQTGGAINIDQNAAGNASNSYTAGGGLQIATSTVSLTGGTLTIVDPNPNTTATAAFQYSGASNILCGTGHTFRYGNGSSTDAGTSGVGFRNTVSGAFAYGNLVIDAVSGPTSVTGSSSTRLLSLGATTYVLGNLTITSGEIYTNSNTLSVAGNITNSGTLTSNSTVALQNYTGSTTASTVAQTISGSGFFRNLLTTPTANFGSLTINNTNATGVTFSGTGWNTGFTAAGGTVSGTLTLTAGRITTGGTAFTLGISGTAGSLTYTAGGFLTGTPFRRWWISSSAPVTTSSAGQFPFLSSANENRSAFYGGAPSSAGYVQVIFNEVAGTANISTFADAGSSISIRSNSNWVVSASGTFATNIGSLRFRGDNLLTLAAASAARAVAVNGSANGTSTVGTGSLTAPEANKGNNLLTAATMAQTYYFGAPNSVMTAQSGDWNDGSTWVGGVVPTACQDAVIKTGHAVTVTTGNQVAGNIVINSTGSLAISAGTLTAACSGTNSVAVNNSGTLSVTGGTFTVNGNVNSLSGSTFSQTGGNIVIDGNNNGASSISVATGTPIFWLQTSSVTLSGGTLTIVDPHVGTATSDDAFRYTSTSSASATTGHTLQLGNGISTEATTNPAGFLVETFASSGRLMLGNVIVNTTSAGATGNRFVATRNTGAQQILGNLTISSGRFQITASNTVAVAGNISNNASMITLGTLALTSGSGTTSTTASTIAQTIDGTGTFGNSTGTSSANFTNLTINNSNATGVTFNSANSLLSAPATGTVSGTLTFTAGRVNVGTGTFIIGISGGSATLSYTAGGFTGGATVRRYFTAAAVSANSVAGQFPFISSEGSARSSFFSGTVTSAGYIQMKFNDFAPSATTDITTPFVDAGATISVRSNTNWVVTTSTSSPIFATVTGNITFRGDNLLSLSNVSYVRAVASQAAATGTSTVGTGSVTAPVANKGNGGLTASTLTQTYYFGAPKTFVTAQSGDWATGSTWVGGVVPTSCQDVVINATHAVTVTTGSQTSGNILINSTGSLSISGGSLTASCTNANNTYVSNSGTLSVSNGTFTVNGNINNISGSTFSQTGGNIVVDGNNANSGPTSVATGTPIFWLQTSNVTLSGGTLTIVDPHVGTASTDDAFRYDNSSSISATTGHTLQLGNGSSIEITSNANGFLVEPYANGRLTLGNVIINTVSTGITGQRYVAHRTAITSNRIIGGNLTIISGRYVANSSATNILTVNGNISNNGEMINTGILSLNGTTAQTISGSGTYSNNTTLASATANFTSLTINNSDATGINFSGNSLLAGATAGTVSGTLTLTAGRISTNGGIFILGVSGTAGTLSYTAGGFTDQSQFRRWWIASSAPALSNPSGQFPFISSTGDNRSAYYTGAPSVAGWVQMKYNDGSGTTPVSITEPGVQITSRSNFSWDVTTGGSFNTAAGSLRFRGDNFMTLYNVATVRAVGAAASVTGTSTVGTGSLLAPEANKGNGAFTGTTMQQSYYIGAPSSILTAQSGDWNDVNTWVGGVIPAACQDVIINSNHAVTVTDDQASGNIVISSNGSLVVSGGSLTVGCTNANNVTVSNSGTLRISGGTLNVNGNINNVSGSTFAQTGGNIVVDGNNNSVAASSVATGTPIFWLQTSNVTLSGGTLTIVDPHVGTAATDDAFRYSSSSNASATTGHTLQFGDGISTQVTNNTAGFLMETYGSGRLMLGNVIVNTTLTDNNGNRFVATHNTSTQQILGNLTITSGRFQITATNIVAVAGNISNNGQLVTLGTLALATGTGTSTSVNSATQTISGSGKFSNNSTVASATANFTNLTINNNSTGVTFSGSNSLQTSPATGTVSGTFNLTQGLINTSGNTFVLGISAASTGTLTYTAGGFGNASSFGRWWGTTIGGAAIAANSNPSGVTGRYPFISGSVASPSDRSFYVSESAAATTGGRINVTFNDGSVMNTVTAFSDVAYSIDRRSDLNWVLTQSVTGGTYAMAGVGADIFNSVNGNTRLTLAGSLVGTHAAGSGSMPVGQRTSVPQASLANTYYLGVNNTDIPFVSINNGDWNDMYTWNRFAVPTATDNVVIASGNEVTVTSNQSIASVTVNNGGKLTMSSNALTVSGALTNGGFVNANGGILNLNNSGTTSLTSTNSSGAIFTIAGGTVNVGASGLNNRIFSNAGTLTVQTGTMNIYGGLAHSGTAFNQSGGAINIDPNAALVLANSLASPNHALNLTAAVNWTGGTLTLVDPTVTNAATHYSVYYNSSTSSNATGHTIRFGDGISSENGGGTSGGFIVETKAGSGRLNFGNVEVNGAGTGTATATSRIVKSTSTTALYGSLTINNRGEYNMNSVGLVVKGNITVNTGGTLTANNTLTFGSPSGASVIANTTAQTISNSGTITDGTNTGLKDVTINSTNTVTVGAPLTINGVLTLTSGYFSTTSTNLLTLATTGSFTGGSATAMVTGPFARVLQSGISATGNYVFPVGKTAYNPFELVNPTTGTGTVTVMAEAFNGNSGGTPGGAFRILSPVRYWNVALNSGAANLTSSFVRLYDATVAYGFDGIGYSSTQTGTYNAVGGATATVTSTSITSTTPAATTIPGYYAMANKAVPPAISNLTLSPSAVQCVATARTATATVTPGAGSVTSVVLSYSVAGGLPFTVNMVNTSGNTWNASIPAANPSGSTITWSVTATDNYNLTSTATGTSYTDDPLSVLSASVTASVNPVCAGSQTSLTGAIGNPATAATYTTPPAVTSPTTDEDLGNITITQGATTILNNTTAINSLAGTIGTATGNVGSYSNFTGAATIAMTAGGTYSFSATTLQSATAYSNAIGIYIDYNRNGVFTDAGEAVYLSSATTSGGHTETGSFTIPASAYNGLTRMRIIVNETSVVSSPTQSVSYGEYEEYLLNISSTTNGGGIVPAFTSYSWSDGNSVIGTNSTLANYTPSTSGTYTLTATNANGCTLTASVALTVNPLPTAPANNGTLATQCGMPTYKVSSSVNGATYKWYTQSSGGPAISGATAATYSYTSYTAGITNSLWVSVTDLNGCESPRTQLDVASSATNAITTTPSGVSVLCQDNIQALSVSSTLSDFDAYTWSPVTNLYTDAAATTPYTGGSASTVYYKNSSATTSETITVIGVNNTTQCSNVATVNMVVNTNPTISVITATPAALCSGSSTSLSATASTSSNWTWSLAGTPVGTSNGSATSTLSVTPLNNTGAPVVNSYITRATVAATGCYAEATVNAVVNNIPDAPTSFTDSVQCGTPVFTVASTVSSPFYKWYPQATGGSAIVGANDATYTPPTFTTGTVTNNYSVSVTDGNSCESPRTTIVVTVSTPPVLTLSQTGNVSMCLGTIQTLSVTSTISNYDSYTWSPVTNLYTDAAATTPYTGGTATTVYYNRSTATAGEAITLTASNSTSACNNTATVNMTVNNKPVVSTITASPTTVCATGSVSLSATANTIGTATVTLGAGASTEFTGSPYRSGLTGVNRLQLLYTKAELLAAGLSAGNFTAMTFNVTSLGTGAMANYTISMANVTDNALTTTLLSPSMTQVYTVASYTAVTGDNKHTFLSPFTWDGNSNVLVNICYSVATASGSSTVKADAAGATTSSFAGSSTATCATTTGATVNANRPYVKFDGPAAANSTSSNTWSWTLNGNSVGTAASITTSPVNITGAPVTNTYMVKATNASSSCFGTATVDVLVNPIPVAPVSSTATTQCGIPVYTVSSPEANATYKWYTQSSGGAAISGATSSTYTFTGYTAGTNTLYVSVVSASGCESARTTIAVTVNTPPALTISQTGTINTCVAAIQTLSVTSTISNFDSYIWSPSTNLYTDAAATTPYTGGSASTVYYKANAANTGEVITVTGSNSSTTCSSNASVTMQVNNTPSINSITATPSSACAGSSVSLSATSAQIGNGSAVVGAGATTTSTFNAPFFSSYSNKHMQILFKASELTASGLLSGSITALSFPTTSGTIALTDVTIKMGQTSATDMSSFISSGLTQVYSASSLAQTANTNNRVALSSPFTWDGTSNIVVEICFGNGASTTTLSSTSPADATSYVSVIKTHATVSTAGATACPNTTSNVLTYSVRPKVLFEGQITTNTTVSNSWNWTLNGSSIGSGASVTTVVTNNTGSPVVNTYTATAADGNTTCTNAATVTVTVNPAPAAPVNATNATQCGVPVYTVSSPETGATYNWYTQLSGGSAVALGTGTSYTYTAYTANTTNTLYASVVSSTGCESARTAVAVTVSTPPALTVSVSGTTTMCLGTIQPLNVTSTVSDYSSYIWSPSTNLYTDAAATTPYTGGSASTVYYKGSAATAGETFTLTALNSGSNCTSVINVTMVVNAAPVITSVTTTAASICSGSTATLTGTATSTDVGSATVGTGTATLGASLSAGGLSPFSQYYEGQHTQYLILASDLSAAGILPGNITSVTFNVSSALSTKVFTSYTVKMGTTAVSTLTGLQSPSFTTVYGPSNLMVSATGPNTLTFASPFTWDGTSNVVMDVCFSNDPSSAGTFYTDNSIVTGTTKTYTATYGYYQDNSALCGTTGGTQVSSTTLPNMTFSGTVNSGTTNWTWTLNGTTIGTSSSVNVSPTNNTGSAVVNTYTATAANPVSGCSNSQTVAVTVNPIPAAPVNATNAAQCGVPVYTVSSPETGATYKWYTQASGGSAISGATSATYTYTGYTAGTSNTLYVSVVSASGCESARTTIAVAVSAPPSLTLSQTGTVSMCPSTIQALSVTSTISDFDAYTWSPATNLYTDAAATAPYTGGSATTVYYKRSSATTGETITVTGVNNTSTCTGNAAVILVVTSNPPISTVTATPSAVCPGSTVTLAATASTIASGTATVGNGSTTTSTYNAPFYSLYSNKHMQILFKASELTASGLSAGSITALSFPTTSGTIALTDVTIKMGQTSATDMSSFISSGLTQVYSASSLAQTVGNNRVALGSSFTWNGTSNIVVEICFGNGSSTATLSSTSPADATSYVSVIKTHATSSTAGATACSDASTNLLTYSVRPRVLFEGQVATTTTSSYTWSWSLNGSSVGTAASTTTVTPTNNTSSPVVNTYTVKATNATTGCFSTSTVNVTVNATPAAPTNTSVAAQCGVPVYSATTSETGATYKWYTQASGGTAISGATSSTYTYTGYTTGATNTLYVSVVSTSGCESARTAASVTVSTPPVLTLSRSGNVSMCLGTIQTLSVTSTISNYDSYTWSPTTNLYTDAAATTPYTGGYATTLYYKRGTSTTGEAITVAAANSGSNCATSVTVTMVVNVNPTITSLTASQSTICSGSSVTFTAASTPTSNWAWTLAGSPVGTATASISVTPSNTTNSPLVYTYTATATVPGTGCTASSTVSVTVYKPSAAPTTLSTTASPVCRGTSATLSQTGGSLGMSAYWQWYTSPSFTVASKVGGQLASSDAQLVVTPTSTTTYYLRAEGGAAPCAGNVPGLTAVTVVVNQPTVGGTAASIVGCINSVPGNVALNGNTGTVVKWQKSTTSDFSADVTDIASTSTTLLGTDIGTLSSTTYVRALVQSGVCTSAFSLAGTISLNAASVGGTISGSANVCFNATPSGSFTLSGNTGSVVKWQKSTTSDFSAGVTDISNTTTTLAGTDIGAVSAATWIRAVVQNNPCTVAYSTAFALSFTPASVGGTAGNAQTICYGAQPANLSVTGITGSVVKWQRSTTSDFSANVTDIANASATLSGATIGSLTTNTYFRALVQSGACSSAYSDAVAVTVQTYVTWTGAQDDKWENANNWCGSVPDQFTDVLIPTPANLPSNRYPVVGAAGGTVRNIALPTSTSLTINGTFNVYGNLDNQGGTLDAANGSLTFEGSSQQDIDGFTATNVTLNGAGGIRLTQGTITVTGTLSMQQGVVDLNGNNMVAGSITGGNSSSFVITSTGSLIVKNITNTVAGQKFPVGTSTSSYSPVTIANGEGLNWRIQVLAGVQRGAPAYYANSALQRTWDIRPYLTDTAVAATPATPTDITFAYDVTHTGILNANGGWDGNATVAIVNHYNPSSGIWETAAGALTPGGTNPAYTLSIHYAGTYSPFVISKTTMPLPVTLLRFSGRRISNGNELKWTTATETNNRGFEVQRSFDGISFTAIGFANSLAPNGNSSLDLNYSFLDVTAGNRKAYYRLRQVDLDNRFHLSSVVIINPEMTDALTLVGLFPNPARTQTMLRVETPVRTSVRIVMTDANGSRVLEQRAALEFGANTIGLPLSNLANGTYYIRVISEDGSMSNTLKLVKQ
jgi:tRNA G46 methylase TrmB